MRILVLNGSPKGKNSVTLQTVNYFQLLYPQHTFEILHVGQRIRMLEKDMTGALDAMQKADLLLFCYPVYTLSRRISCTALSNSSRNPVFRSKENSQHSFLLRNTFTT